MPASGTNAGPEDTVTIVAFGRLSRWALAPCSRKRDSDESGNVLRELEKSLKDTLKEHHHEDYATRAQARASIFEYIEAFYNRVRRHSALGYVVPAEYERTHNQPHR